jgi:hypothetical protein
MRKSDGETDQGRNKKMSEEINCNDFNCNDEYCDDYYQE